MTPAVITVPNQNMMRSHEGQRLFANPDVRDFLSLYVAGVMQVRGLNPMAYLGKNDLKAIRTFIKEIGGIDNAKAVLEMAFDKYRGTYRGMMLQENLFVPSFRWVARNLLAEYYEQKQNEEQVQRMESRYHYL